MGDFIFGGITSGGDLRFEGGSCLIKEVNGCLGAVSGTCFDSGGISHGGEVAACLGGKFGGATGLTGDTTPGGLRGITAGSVGLIASFGGVNSRVGGVGDRFDEGVDPWVDDEGRVSSFGEIRSNFGASGSRL